MARLRNRWKWLIGALAVVLVVVVGAPFVYTRFIAGDAPDPLALSTTGGARPGQSAEGAATTASSGAPAPAPSTPASGDPGAHSGSDSDLDGVWTVGQGTVVGYRVEEVLFGQSTTAVGRTSAVTGQMTVSGSQVSSGTFTVDMTTVKSDRSQRDSQFNGRIMSASTYPTATFTLTRPIELGSVPADKQPVSTTATGDLTLRGVTRNVTLDVKAQRNGANIEVNGSYPVTFADWQIPNATLGPVSTEDHGILEFLLVLTR